MAWRAGPWVLGAILTVGGSGCLRNGFAHADGPRLEGGTAEVAPPDRRRPDLAPPDLAPADLAPADLAPADLAPPDAPAPKQSVLDQSFDPTTGSITASAGFGGGTPTQERAQTFTVGIGGQLTRIDAFVKVFGTPTGQLVLDLRPTVAGAPEPSPTPAGVLATVSVAASGVKGGSGGFTSFQLPAPINVAPGQVYAIVQRATAGASTFAWLGATSNPYPAGGSHERVIGNHNWVVEIPGVDLGFRSWVEPP